MGAASFAFGVCEDGSHRETLIKFSNGDIVVHENGHQYCVLLTPANGVIVERTTRPAYLYYAVNPLGHTLWVRPQDEMEDGRFTLVQAASEKIE